MEIFDITSPPNEFELSKLIRRSPLTGAVLELTVIHEPDELSARRNNKPVSKNLQFTIETIHTTRPVAILGQVAMDGASKPGRIDTLGDSEDDKENHLRLTVVD